jgi:Spy/CpxP family protein refolding chaperone
MATLTDGSITRRLVDLDADERAISAERRDLHRQIGNPDWDVALAGSRAAILEQLDRVSAQRRELHVQINDLRAEVGTPLRVRWSRPCR